MNLVTTSVLIFACVNLSFAAKVRYDGFQVHRVTPKTPEAAKSLKVLEDNGHEYDFWTSVKGEGYPVDVMVPPHLKDGFLRSVDTQEFDSRIFIADVQQHIEDNENLISNSRSTRLVWSDYSNLNQINDFLYELEEANTEVEVVSVGSTYEGRYIYGVNITFGTEPGRRRVFIEANIHAREWITSAVATWILNQFFDDNISVEDNELIRRYDWIVVPVFNPDGFVYSIDVDRLWRKTRTPYFMCRGVDPNRNWDYHFNDGGSSGFPCDNTYRGPEPFSELSTSTISEFITSVSGNLHAYISLHSYSQLLLIPYGHTSEHLDNYDDLFSVGQQAIDALRGVHGTEYQVGNVVEVLYVASGGSVDWVKGTFQTNITYTYELRDTGTDGFVLPPEQIIPCAEETFVSLLTILRGFEELEQRRNKS